MKFEKSIFQTLVLDLICNLFLHISKNRNKGEGFYFLRFSILKFGNMLNNPFSARMIGLNELITRFSLLIMQINVCVSQKF